MISQSRIGAMQHVLDFDLPNTSRLTPVADREPSCRVFPPKLRDLLREVAFLGVKVP